MRSKRSKKYRKTMQNYAQTFGFRPPYQVLMTQSFLRTCHAFHMPLQKYIDNTLQDQARIFVTRCTLAKIMKEYGKEKIRAGVMKEGDEVYGRPEYLPPPTEVPLRHCKHNEQGSPVQEHDCLADLLSGEVTGNQRPKNKQHFILADAPMEEKKEQGGSRKREREGEGDRQIDVRDVARAIPGVPIVYVKRSVMILEEMSGASMGAKGREERDRMKEGTYGGRGQKRGREDEEDKENEEEVTQEIPLPAKQPQKKIKGANPLSARKKKSKEQSSRAPPAPDTQPKAKRRRKHGVKKDPEGVPAAAIEA